MSEHKKIAIIRHFDAFPRLLICMDICSKGGQAIFGNEPPELSMKMLSELRAEGKIKRTFYEVHGINWCEITKIEGK